MEADLPYWQWVRQKVKASWTVWLGVGVTVFGTLLDGLDFIIPIVSTPDAQKVIVDAFGSWGTHFFKIVGVLILICRLRPK